MGKKTENKKEVKHLFGTSGKSDFIVNMTEESAQKMSGVYAIICIVFLCVMAIPYYFTKNIKYGVDETVNRTLYLNEKFIFFISTAVIITGFIGFLIFLISISHFSFPVKTVAVPLTLMYTLYHSNTYNALINFMYNHITFALYYGEMVK